MTGVHDTMNKLASIAKDNSGLILTIMIFFMITLFILYAYVTLRKREFNCEVLKKNRILSMTPISLTDNRLLKDCVIKTAYNCCCTGDFRNDYVDYCGLLNCAKQGFRALDFQIFSLNGLPVVSESTVKNNNYKEMYNSLPFNDVLINIKRYFIQDVTNCPNITDPLFLIFRFNTNNTAIFDIVYNAINVNFGNGNSLGSMLYTPQVSSTIDDIQLKNIAKKIIIVIDTTGLTNFESSKLYGITALKLGTTPNQIYRQSDVVSNMINDDTFKNKFRNNLNMLYPDIETSSNNYDFVTTGINNGIQFIAMNAQTPDTYLNTYNTSYFNQNAFISKITVNA